MAEWKEYKIKDIVEEIDSYDFVLPVIQRRLVWNEEKMALLFELAAKEECLRWNHGHGTNSTYAAAVCSAKFFTRLHC